MKSTICLFVLCLFIGSIMAQERTVKSSVYFESAKHDLKDLEFQKLKQAIDSIRQFQIKKIIIRGNTDNIGDSIYNILLSERRSKSCRIALNNLGIKDSLIKLSAFGENRPISDNTSDDGKYLNRRVDIIITYVIPKEKDTAKLVSIKQLFKLTERKPQVYCINPNRDTIIKGAQGSMVIIKAGTFKLKNNCKNGCLNFELKEDYLKSDILLDDLSTTSDGRILESQAMVYTNATDCEGKGIEIQSGKSLTIMTPTDTILPEAKIFRGMRTPHDSIMNWKLLDKTEANGFRMRDLFLCNSFLCGTDNTCDCIPFVCRIFRLGTQISAWFDPCTKREVKLYRKDIQINRLESRLSRISRNQNNQTRTKSILERIERKKERKIEINERFNTCTIDNNGTWRENNCNYYEKLFKQYGVSNINDLLLALNKGKMDSLGVTTLQDFYDTIQKLENKRIQLQQQKQMEKYGVNTMQELEDTLRQINRQSYEKAISNGDIPFSDLQYYIFNTNKLGWSNVDIFANLDNKNTGKISVKIKPDVNIDCKLIFKKRRIILPAEQTNSDFEFKNIPNGTAVWVVVVKYYKDQVYLFMEEIRTDNQSVKVELKACSIEELRKALKVLDGI